MNCGWTTWAAHRVMVIRRVRVFVWLAFVNSTRAVTALAPRRSEAVRTVSVQRPFWAFVTVLTLWPRTKNVTRRICRPRTLAETDVVRGQARGPWNAAVPRAGRLAVFTPATACAGAGCGVGVGVGVDGGCGVDGGVGVGLRVLVIVQVIVSPSPTVTSTSPVPLATSVPSASLQDVELL